MRHAADFAPDLRQDLVDSGYTITRLSALLGQRAQDALEREQLVPALTVARQRSGPAATLARLFLFGDVLTRDELDAALPRTATRVIAAGLVAATWEQSGAGALLRATIDLRPVDMGTGEFYLASDMGEAATREAIGAEHVLGAGWATRTLAELTVRTPARRALDLGTGSGILALCLSTWADRVVATDISARTLEFATFNALLNDCPLATDEPHSPGVQTRHGSLLEPVAGEQFDLVVSNPPFVITPRGSEALPDYTYRDAGGTGDEMARGLVTGLRTHLAPGGNAQMLLNWEIHDLDRPFERIEQWCRDSGLDAWVIGREVSDPCQYAETWLRDGGITPERDWPAWERGYCAWVEDFDRRGVEAVGFGYLILHRPGDPAQEQWIRTEQITSRPPGTLGATIAATLAAKDALAHLDDAALAAQRLTVAADVTEERHYRPGATDPEVILLHQGSGFGRSVRADTALAAVVGTSDGDLTVAQIAAGVAALTDTESAAVLDSVLADIRGLILDGFLLLPGYRRG